MYTRLVDVSLTPILSATIPLYVVDDLLTRTQHVRDGINAVPLTHNSSAAAIMCAHMHTSSVDGTARLTIIDV